MGLTFVAIGVAFDQVRGRELSSVWLAWHWVNVVVNAVVMVACVAASIHYIIHDSTTYHVFADL